MTLRKALSRYLRREPWVDESDPLEQLIARRLATRGAGGLASIEPLPLPLSDAGTRALEEERAERLG